MFVITVDFLVAAEFSQSFAAAVAKQAENSLQLESHCYVFDVCTSLNNTCAFFLYEKYTDAAAFDVHLKSEHFKAFDALVKPWVTTKTVNRWTTSGSYA
jgi:quinol monooxygenase YgiN